MLGRINSFQSLGTVDGPGVRFVVFLQGCNLKCAYCHNPETWDVNDGLLMSAKDVFKKVLNYRPYFGDNGGLTISGGEPLIQAEFICELLTLCKNEGINTVIDTNGTILTPESKMAVELADLIIIDLKMNTNKLYKEYIGTDLDRTLKFIKMTHELKKDIWIRQVIVPTINNKIEDIIKLKQLLMPFSNIKKIELLPFQKLCLEKYESLNIEFPLKHLPQATKEDVLELEEYLK